MADGTERGIRFEEFTGLTIGRALLVAVPVLALVVASIWLAVQFLDPMPPRRIVLATGPEGSALHALGERYAERVSAQGIAVDVRATRGPADNVVLLGDRRSASMRRSSRPAPRAPSRPARSSTRRTSSTRPCGASAATRRAKSRSPA